MNPLVFHIASGQSFFSGIALVLVSIFASTRKGPFARRVLTLSLIIGLIAVVLSSTAIPYWSYAVVAVATLVWLTSAYAGRCQKWAPMVVALAWIIAAALEVPQHITPTLQPASLRWVTIIGDSITAGLDERDTETWPKILAREHKLDVQDISHVGETCASALRRAQMHTLDSPLIILEIGGNDLLGSTSARQFAQDLDRLLAHLSAPGRQVVMFELPLPPFCHEYGRIQRTLADKYGVALLPKRVLLGVLAESDSTLDTIHLTAAGHERLANRVWQILSSAFSQTVDTVSDGPD